VKVRNEENKDLDALQVANEPAHASHGEGHGEGHEENSHH